ncbi:MAG: response regulator, partial [Acidiferrobacterales bacterium]|nr:response regulator [Acidiferrobacterales bacterium]
MATKTEPTIFVVDDEADIRDSLRLLMRSVGLKTETFASAQEFLGAYDPSRPGCLILDVRMPGMSGPELQEKLRKNEINIPIIIITGHGDVPTAVRTMKAGAIDVIEKPFSDQLLLDRVQQALERDATDRKERAERERIAARLARLTPREREVMEGIVDGKLNKVIAADLGLSTRTVEIHRSRIMEKMQVRSVSN